MNQVTPINREERELRPSGKISFEEFLAWADEDVHAEWEDEEVVLISPAGRIHQKLLLWLSSLLSYYVNHHKLGEVLTAPFVVRLHVMEQGREPDLLFVGVDHLDRLHETYLDGPADLLVEVVSPESISRDRGRKYIEYEAEGVHEYWLLDPLRRQAEFYQLGQDGHYQMVMPPDHIYRSAAVAGFWLNTQWLWQDPLPNGLDILRQLNVIS